MKIYLTLALLAVLTMAGCKAPAPPITDDTLVTSTLNGVSLTHRHVVQAPKEFTPVGENYRALYRASVMTTPNYGGKIVGYLENSKPFTVLGKVENDWLAIADADQTQLIGYVPVKAGVPGNRYDATVRNDRRRPRTPAKQVCVNVGGDSKACRSGNTATWILE